MAAGMSDYTTKPIDRHALALVLKKAVTGGAEKPPANCEYPSMKHPCRQTSQKGWDALRRV